MPIKIDGYTGEWQAALRPVPPRVGSHVWLLQPNAGTADGREWDGFSRVLKKHGLELEYLRSTPNKWDVSVVVRAAEATDSPFPETVRRVHRPAKKKRQEA